MKRFSAASVFFTLATAISGTATAATPVTEWVIRHASLREMQRPISPSGPPVALAPRRELVVEVDQGAQSFRAAFEVGAPADALPLWVERVGKDGAAVEFQHPITLQGEAAWSAWVPAEPRTRTHGMILSEEPLLHIESADQARVLRFFSGWSGNEEPHALGFSWAPGKYHWQYDPKKFKPWAGYLWDFKKGELFRGYRRGWGHTPSTKQESWIPAEIAQFYAKLNAEPHFTSQFTAANSRPLSPLDKWGIWASRAHGAQWWSADAWEAEYHHRNMKWGGYCNSSAATVFLFPRPTRSWVSQNLTFDPRDLVGILQVATYLVDFEMWGWRYNGNPGDQLADPSPVLIVNTIFQYLGRQGIPLVTDIYPGSYVDNHIILSADLLLKVGKTASEREGELKLKVLGYWKDARAWPSTVAEVPDGASSQIIRDLKYSFKVKMGNAFSDPIGTWAKPDAHPDFLWLPTGFGNFGPPYYRNPYLRPSWVNELVKMSTH